MVREYTFINAFRALAAFWVLLTHCMIWGGWMVLPLPSGKMAVDLFMIISGYLMAANARHRWEREPLSMVRNQSRFLMRRFFRIAPAYYLSLTMVVLLSQYYLAGYQELKNASPHQWLRDSAVYDPARIEYSAGNMLLHFSFLFGLGPEASFSTFLPDWSLSLEMQFYLAFPILFMLMCRHGFIKAGLLIGLGAVLFAYLFARELQYYEPSLLFLKLQYFVVGMMVFHVSTLRGGKWQIAGVIVVAMSLASMEFGYGRELFVLPLLVFTMFVLDLMEQKSTTPKLLRMFMNSRLISFASQTSYGVYLFHGFFISAAGLLFASQSFDFMSLPHQRVIFMFVFVSMGSYLTGYVVYRLIELPGINLGKRMIDRFVPIKK
jgi:peptidoglycan/LPS O-acetylase OafA/YrhL